ncbi:2-hydroxyhepta-2,4-diene-1,7-dioate isomerase [Aspergillus unguis]
MVDPDQTPFPIDNIPFGVISTPDNPIPRCATAFQHNAVDLGALEVDGFFNSVPGFAKGPVFAKPHLNDFASLPVESRRQVRHLLREILLQIQEDAVKARRYLVPLRSVQNHYPMLTGNFSDFYCSLEHAQNCSAIMNLSVLPNWYAIPSVYNGRTSSLTVSPTVTRPHGVIKDEAGGVAFRPSKQLDFELEMGVFVSQPLERGRVLNIQDAKDHIFGFVLLNDWSARDIQAFEMAPLGPFHSKGFATSISPWIVTMDALESAQSAVVVQQNPPPLPHLTWSGGSEKATFDIKLSARIISKTVPDSFLARDVSRLTEVGNGRSYHVTDTNLNELYWTPYQQLTHLASAGEGLSTGDILGTGTISSARTNHEGHKTGLACLLERSLPSAALPALQSDGPLWLEDSDELIIEGWCVSRANGAKFGFGQCRGRITPAVQLKV